MLIEAEVMDQKQLTVLRSFSASRTEYKLNEEKNWKFLIIVNGAALMESRFRANPPKKEEH